MTSRGHLSLVVGPVGAGKSTFAEKRALRDRAVFLDLDAWMVRLYGDDSRPPVNRLAWYFERRGRVRELLWDMTLKLRDSGTDVFLELGLVTQAEREAFYERARAEDLELRVYLVDAPREVRRDRVALRNGSGEKHTQVVPIEFFERASDAWEGVGAEERLVVSVVDV